MIGVVLAASWLLPVILMMLDGRRPAVGWLATAGLAGIAGILALLGAEVIATGAEDVITGGWPAGVGIRLRADALGITFALLTTVVMAAATAHQTTRGIASRWFPALAALLSLGLVGLFLTADAFNFYVFFEVSMTAAFALVAYGGTARRYRAALTFAVVNLLGSFAFLAAVAGLYHVTGTLDLPQIRDRIGDVSPAALLVIAALVFVAFGLKLGLFPFHYWLPPVYRDSSPAIAAMLSGALANIGSYGLLRIGAGVLAPALESGAWLLLALGAASALYGGLVAVSRALYAEVLAYSSIAQAGYVLIAIGLGGPEGLAAAVVFAVVNSLNKTVLFLGLDAASPLVPIAAAVGAASVAGLPPSSGFFGKVAVLRATMVEAHVLMAAIVVAGSVLSLVYMVHAHVHRFWRGPAPRERGRAEAVVPMALAAVVLVLGLWPEPLAWVGARAAAVLE